MSQFLAVACIACLAVALGFFGLAIYARTDQLRAEHRERSACVDRWA
jgi:hypothetical protein